MNSALYRGRVSHTRLRPFRHRFEYRVYYLLLDIDEIPALRHRLRLWSHNRFNLFGTADADHGDGNGLRSWVDTALAEAGLRAERVSLLAFPRVLGHVFDPISIWYAWDTSDRLIGIVHEVHNTFGDRHAYVAPVTDEDLRHGFDKQLHVSPFMDMRGRYEFAMTAPGQHLTVGIRQHDDDGELFRASMRLTRLDLNDRTLLRLFITHPLVTLNTVGAIHWQALRLWRKGATFHRRPEPVVPNVTVIERATP